MSATEFYNRVYADGTYDSNVSFHQHGHFDELREFVERFGLKRKKCLEIGCGRGVFQNMVEDYTGVDIHRFGPLEKPYVQASATHLPFGDSLFDAVWTISVLEHVPEPARALAEIRRVLKPGDLVLLSPAWQCRPWAADGYMVRPYSDFGIRGKFIKASIPLRNSVFWRSMYVFPRRLSRSLFASRPTRLHYRKLRANYEIRWCSDSDACSSIDPYEAILWFTSRGDECVTFPTELRQFFVRNGGIVFRIHKESVYGSQTEI